MKFFSRRGRLNNTKRELRERHLNHEAEIAERNEAINFVTQHSVTLENTIENFNLQEYVAELGRELEDLNEVYEAEIIELREIIAFQIRTSATDDSFRQINNDPSPYAARRGLDRRPTPPKQEISIDYLEVEQVDEDSKALRAFLLADEYDDVLELEVDELTGYKPIHINGKTDVAAMGNPTINGANHATTTGFLHGQEHAPDDLLMDSGGLARVIGDADSKASKLISMIMENDWKYPAISIQSRFPGEYINVIFDEINSTALEEIGDNIILEEDGLWIIGEEYRGEIEYILQYP